MTGERAQASVETIVLVPIVAALAAGAWQALLLMSALATVQDAAEAGARAAMAGEPPRAAVLRALPRPLREGAVVTTGRGSLSVRVRVPSMIPGVGAVVSESAPVVRG